MSNIDQLHQIACQEGRDTYIDPATGYQVLTSKALIRRGTCCGNSCRHCPYGHINVSDLARTQAQITKPVLMNWVPRDGSLDVLFWSGGKDSFLALSQLVEENKNVILLTSFGAITNRVSIQDIHIKNIAKQSEFFNIPLCLVPLFPNTDYRENIKEALNLIQSQTGINIQRLVFGDLHLQNIRQWRVETWSEYEIYTPLFNVPYTNLLSKLWKLEEELGLTIELSTEVVLYDKVFPVGCRYTPDLVEELRISGVDEMLENGEGHTLVFPKNVMQS